MALDEATFKQRTRKLGLDVIAFVDGLPRDMVTVIIARQLVRSATSVGANYRSACRGKSAADVTAKLAIVEEEADETGYWLEMLADAGRIDARLVESLRREADEIVAMTVASIKTMRARANPKSKI
jgi:four helix bundle protein